MPKLEKTYQYYVTQALHRACNEKHQAGLLGILKNYFTQILNDPIELNQLLKSIVDKSIPQAAPIKIDGESPVNEIVVTCVVVNGKNENKISPSSSPEIDYGRQEQVQSPLHGEKVWQDNVSDKRIMDNSIN